MELRVNEMQLPEKIDFNYEELKKELLEKVSVYETLVYTDEQIKEAKADKAKLNKLKKALNDERIRREKEYMIPFNEFKAKVNEIIGIIDKPVAVIDAQVKAYEEKQKQEKLEAIKKVWESKAVALPFVVTFEQIFNERWLNSTTSMNSVKEEIDARLEQIDIDLATLKNLPQFSFEAVEVYKATLDIRNALNEANKLAELAKKKQEAEAKVIEEQLEGQITFTDNETFNAVVEEAKAERLFYIFDIMLSGDELLALTKYMKEKGIEYSIR